MPNDAGITEADLDEGWKRALNHAFAAAVPDILRWEDHKLIWPIWKGQLLDDLEANSYEPSPPTVVEVPKDDFSSRPIAVLHPRDHALYEAVVGRIAHELDGQLGDDVFSARIGGLYPKYTMPNQTKAWAGLERTARELCAEYDVAFMLKTDVTSYFEQVEFAVLAREVLSVPGVDAGLVRLLSKMLNGFQRTSDIWGLPQGPSASSILGNFYLLAVDRVLVQLDVRSLRFQDDFKIFSGDPTILRIALRDVIRVLRNRHLSIAVSKTKMLEGLEILAEIEDARKDAIQYGIEVGASGVAAEIEAFFDKAASVAPVRARDIKFAVLRLARVGSDHAVPWILANLEHLPYLAPVLVEYLSGQSNANPDIVNKATEYLGDTSRNIYPFVEMELLRMLARSAAITDSARSVAWAAARDGNREIYVREHAIRCLGRHARPADEGALRTMFTGSGDLRLRRALLVAITEAAGADNAWLVQIERGDPDLAHTCSFLRRGGTPPDP